MHLSKPAHSLLGDCLGQISKSLSALELCVLNDTGIGITGEVTRPLNECVSGVCSRCDWEKTNGADDGRVGKLRLSSNDRVGDEVINRLQHCQLTSIPMKLVKLTECSSCFTSKTVPSLNVHLTTSVSGLAPLTKSLDLRFDQKLPVTYSKPNYQLWLRSSTARTTY